MPRLHAPETRWFDDFAIGETFYIPSRTMTDALLSFSGEMHHPLYAGDTAYPGLEIIKLTPQRTTGIIEMRAIVLNQHDQLIMEGTHRYLLKKNSRLMINHFEENLRQAPLTRESRKAEPNRHAKKRMHHQGQSANQWRVWR